MSQVGEGLSVVPEVQRWLTSAGYDDAPVEENAPRLALLGAFCDFTARGPGELVESCLRTTKHGDTAISAKGRNAMNDTIDAFTSAQGLSGRDAVVAGNTIRGFLVHNGVFIQGPVWRP